MDPMELAAGIRAAAGAPEGAAIKVVANLPYYITTDVLKKYLPLGGAFSNLIFMLQVEPPPPLPRLPYPSPVSPVKKAIQHVEVALM